MTYPIYEITKKIAKESGLSLAQVALDAGLTRNAIYNWKDVVPQERSVRAVANVLHVTPQYLKGDTDTKNDIDSKSGEVNSFSSDQFFDLEFLENYNVGFRGHQLTNDDIQLIKELISPVLNRISRK